MCKRETDIHPDRQTRAYNSIYKQLISFDTCENTTYLYAIES